MTRYQLERCEVIVYEDDRRVETRFDDGEICIGRPTFTEEQRTRAISLGYGDSDDEVWRMHYEHELLHSVIAEAAGLNYSPSLRYAIDGPPPKGVIPIEERVVFLVQRALNDGRAILPEAT